MVFSYLLNLFSWQVASTIAADDSLQTVDQGGAQPYQMTSFAELRLLQHNRFGVNVSLGKNTKAQQTG